MCDRSDPDQEPEQSDLEAMKSVALDIIARVQSGTSGSPVLPHGINDIYITMSYCGATLEVEISTAKKIHEPRRFQPEERASARSS